MSPSSQPLSPNSKTRVLHVQLIWRQTPKLCITVYWNKNILLLLSSTIKEKKTFVSLNNSHKNSHRNHTKSTFFKNILRSINRSLRLTECIPQIILCLWGFLCVSYAGCRGNKITALSNHLIFSTTQKSVQKKTQIRIHLMQLAHNQKSGSTGTLISVASHVDLPRALSNAPS